MDLEAFNNKIIICKDKMKNSLLRIISNSKKLLNIKIITLSELKKKYYFDFEKESIYFVCNKYNVNYDIAKKYISNLYYISDINEDKIELLKNIKNDLDDNNLLLYNELFREYLKNKDIVLFDLKNIDKFYYKIFDELSKYSNIIEYNIEGKKTIKELYKAIDMDEEINFVASKICELIKSGIDINNIKLANVNEGYYFTIKKTFNIFNIPVDLPSFSCIKGSKIVNEFKNNYCNDIKETIEFIKPLIVDEKDNDIYKSIINIVNSYNFVDDYMLVKDLLINDIENISIRENKYNNSVRVVDIENEIINDRDYVFLINYNEGVIPHNYKDEDFLSDKIKNKIGISDSYDLNKKSLANIKEKISLINHLIVTYRKHDLRDEIYISSSYESDLFEEKDINITFNNSDLFNKLVLISEKDENNKFGVVSNKLILLNSHYKDEKYLDYSNKFSGISKDKILKFYKNGLTLSYTSINNYYECAFRYYLDNVLKTNKFEDSFEMTVGNIFHHILSVCFEDSFDFDSSWDYELKNNKYEFDSSEEYFISILKNELLLIIKTIKNQLNYTQLKKSMYEKEIIIDVNSDLHIRFRGFVDKIMYDEFNGETIVAIVDYKTGNPIININNVKYGLDMQLPVYMYLIKNEIKNVRIGGFYLQKILSNERDIDTRIENLKLQGYSNSDEDILKYVDTSYNDSNIIKSLKRTNNGFYYHSKMINDEEIDKLYNIVDSNIRIASEKIINGIFDINPKKIKDKLRSCAYCRYKDICYMKNEDIVELPEVKDIFGGDE
ncbi:MAG: PD-(D/E)XK nuclease family protein [Bacilli bacterium]|nr:PD-(D/E)XK nuclease family protein [Bacilli bacterium]